MHTEYDMDADDEIMGSLDEFDTVMGRRHPRPLMLYPGSFCLLIYVTSSMVKKY